MEPMIAEAASGNTSNTDATPGPSSTSHRFRFHGTGNAFFLLILKNLLLTLVTFGIYAAWAKTQRRKFVWQNTEFHGQRFSYRGTGEELFIGYLKVAACYAVFILVPVLLRQISPEAAIAVQVAFGLGLLFLIPFAIYWSRAYLLSRTSWRGVSFALSPGAKPFAKAFLLGYLLTILTLGLYAPIWMNRIHAISINRTQVAHTYFGTARARSTLEGGELFRLSLIYIFGTTFTLGLAFPWIVCYALDTVFQKLSFEGDIDFARVGRAEPTGNAVGDGLADAMDLGLSL